jgi:hypothetical protein
MKPLILALLMLCLSGSLMAQKMVKLKVNWLYTNIIEGYDHNCKTKIFIDGTEIAESNSAPESVKSELIVEVAKGRHYVQIVNLALYEGAWEEVTVDNNYSTDSFYEDTITFKKKPVSVSLVFDISTGSTEVKVK